VSFFLKGSGSVARGRFRALMYGLFIVVLYTVPIAVIILLTWLLGGDAVTADIFNWLSTHWLPNILFFVVFMVFAASFFGAFEIVLPEKLVNNSDAKADKGGLVGIFFMALTLVLVSFSCTGPIIGSALIQSTSGEVWTPILTMLAFSVVFALPFTLFALFPSWLKQLPKSGGWLNSVKVVLGFVELALGLKFLSVADQTYHWGLLDREVYLALWIAIFSLLGLYLLGKIKFKQDSDMPYLSVTRLVLAIVAFSFVVYMLPGMWGAPLKALSGYLPPIQTQDFVMGSGSAVAAEAATPTSGVKYGDVLELPHDLDGFFDLEEAEAYAKQVGKPLFIDFTGHGCVNCREMEARVWSDPRVLDILRNEYVIVALYADDKLKVDEADWVTTDAGKVLKTLGKINSYYALKTYGVNAQPYYVLQGNEGTPMVTPRGYDLDVQGFIDFLQSGVEAYKAGK
jgi:thiol:disulfide interchange protein DsbD